MWIFCCGNQRSGSTLQYQITSEIIESLGIGRRRGQINNESFGDLMMTENKNNEYLVVKTHDFIIQGAELIKKGEAKAIYAYRDLRDVMISLMSTLGRSFYSLLRDGYADFFLKVDYEWSRVPGMHISKYEEIIKDRKREVLRIADYLGLKITDSVAREIADKYSIEEQKKRIEGIDYKTIYREAGRNNAPDPYSMLKLDHIHSPVPGQWRMRLSKMQLGMVESIAHKWLIKKGYGLSQPRIIRYIAGLIYLFFLKIPRFLRSRARYLLGKGSLRVNSREGGK